MSFGLCLLQTLRAQKSIIRLQSLLLALLIVEGALAAVFAVAYVVWLLKQVAKHRSALFTVFLTIPNGFLRTLASRSVSIGNEEDAGSDDGECCTALARFSNGVKGVWRIAVEYCPQGSVQYCPPVLA